MGLILEKVSATGVYKGFRYIEAPESGLLVLAQISKSGEACYRAAFSCISFHRFHATSGSFACSACEIERLHCERLAFMRCR